MNEYDSNRILDITKKINYSLTKDLIETNCYILNTCHIREKATEKVYHDIGRVKKEFRNLGYARELMQFILNFLKLNYPALGIELSAQEYLLKFYISLGFNTIGEMYLEDGIPHVKMVYFS